MSEKSLELTLYRVRFMGVRLLLILGVVLCAPTNLLLLTNQPAAAKEQVRLVRRLGQRRAFWIALCLSKR